MEILIWIITIIVVIVSLLGILLVLIQSSKGGAGGLFGDAGSSSVIGSEQRGDFFSRVTSILLGIFILGSFGLAYLRYQSQTISLDTDEPVLESKDEKGKIEEKPKEIVPEGDAAAPKKEDASAVPAKEIIPKESPKEVKKEKPAPEANNNAEAPKPADAQPADNNQ